MEERCKNCDGQQACVPFFLHENAMMHSNATNRRMFLALIAVCLTFIITVVIFVTGYTAREKAWLDTINRTPVQEAADGVLQQPDP